MPNKPAEPSPEVAPTQETWDTLSRQCTSSAKQSGQISDELYDRTIAAYEREKQPAVAPRETQTEPTWISVKDRLPAYGVPVWVVYQRVVQHIAYARDIGEWRPITDDSDGMPESAVSHWMPMPEPPAREGGH